jgi:hypothetical protein
LEEGSFCALLCLVVLCPVLLPPLLGLIGTRSTTMCFVVDRAPPCLTTPCCAALCCAVLLQGANANVPASDFRLLHPLLYTQTKGKVRGVVCSFFGFDVLRTVGFCVSYTRVLWVKEHLRPAAPTAVRPRAR